jgi:tetratricopeptide (TPR) repeat protein
MLADDFDLEQGREALELAEAFGRDDVHAQALITVGTGRLQTGDPAGIEALERGLELALAGNWLDAAVRGYSNLAAFASGLGGRIADALELTREAQRLAERLGSTDQRRWAQGNMLDLLIEVGEWDEAVRAADAFLAESQALGPHYLDSAVQGARALVRLARDDVSGALADQASALASARVARDPQALHPALRVACVVAAEAGRPIEAREFLDELLSDGPGAFDFAGPGVGDLLWVASIVDREEEARLAVAARGEGAWLAAAQAALDEDLPRAAAVFEGGQALYTGAVTRLRAAEALVAAGRRAEADEQLHEAFAFFRSVRATRYLRAGEALLVASA